MKQWVEAFIERLEAHGSAGVQQNWKQLQGKVLANKSDGTRPPHEVKCPKEYKACTSYIPVRACRHPLDPCPCRPYRCDVPIVSWAGL